MFLFNTIYHIHRFFISQGAVIDALGGDLVATPLHWAIREGHLQMVVLLMQNGLVFDIYLIAFKKLLLVKMIEIVAVKGFVSF